MYKSRTFVTLVYFHPDEILIKTKNNKRCNANHVYFLMYSDTKSFALNIATTKLLLKITHSRVSIQQ